MSAGSAPPAPGTDAGGNSARPRSWPVPVLIALAGVLCWANALRAPFLFDDYTLEQVLSPARRPLVWALHRLDRAISETSTLGDHLQNVVIHVLAGLVLYGVVRRSLELALREASSTARSWLAGCVALLWVVHPLQTESVTYLAQRAEALAGLFYLGALYGLIRGATAGNGAFWLAVSFLSFALGMSAKETVATAPFVLLLYDRTFLAGTFRRSLTARKRFYVPLFAAWAVLFGLLVSWQLFEERAQMGFKLESVGPLEYARTQPAVLLHYLRLVFWPHPLCLDYGWLPAERPGEYLPQCLLVLLLLALTTWGVVRRSWLGFAGAWFFAILAPTSSFMPLADIAFEHRMYLSLAAPLLVLVLAAWRLAGTRPAGRAFLAGAGLLVTVLLAATTIRRNRDYGSEVRIWQTVVSEAPHNARAYCNLGVALSESGRPEEALEALSRSVAIFEERGWRGAVLAHASCNLGAVLKDLGRPQEAVEVLRKTLAICERDGVGHLEGITHYDLGLALVAAGRTEEALEHFQRGLTLLAEGDRARSVGDLYLERGRPDLGRAFYELALRLEPSAVTHRHLARALRLRQEPEQAVRHLEEALRLQPDMQEAHLDLSQALLALGRHEEALEHGRAALAIAPDIPVEHSSLGRVLLDAGRPEEALAEFGRAVAMDGELLVPLLGGLEGLAQTWHAAGDTARAIAALEIAVALPRTPGSAPVQDRLRATLEEYRSRAGSL